MFFFMQVGKKISKSRQDTKNGGLQGSATTSLSCSSSHSDPTGSCQSGCRPLLCGDEQTASALASRLPGWERTHLVVQLKSCPGWTALKTPLWKKVKDKNQTTRVWERQLGRSTRWPVVCCPWPVLLDRKSRFCCSGSGSVPCIAWGQPQFCPEPLVHCLDNSGEESSGNRTSLVAIFWWQSFGDQALPLGVEQLQVHFVWQIKDFFFFPGNTFPLKHLTGFHYVFIGRAPGLKTRTIDLAELWSLDEDRIWLGYFGLLRGFPCGSAGKDSVCSAGDLGSTPGLGRWPGEGQYSGLENSMDCIVHGVAKSWTWLSDFHFTAVSWASAHFLTLEDGRGWDG